MLWYNVEITIDGGREFAGPEQKFTYYRDPKITEVTPHSGPIKGGTKVKVFGTGFNQEGACNKVVRFSVFELRPTNENNDTCLHVTSPKVNIPDSVVVSVSLNGQQFIKDIILHWKDVENTYDYYVDPVISGIYPKSGPSIGGTQVVINGIDFMSKKDLNGNPDPKKNRAWVRFVDPDTNEPLASEYEV